MTYQLAVPASPRASQLIAWSRNAWTLQMVRQRSRAVDDMSARACSTRSVSAIRTSVWSRCERSRGASVCVVTSDVATREVRDGPR